MNNERIDVLAVPGHSSAEVATWTAQQAIAFMAAEMKTYRPDIEAKCNEARAAVAELIAASYDLIEAESSADHDEFSSAFVKFTTALARVQGGAE